MSIGNSSICKSISIKINSLQKQYFQDLNQFQGYEGMNGVYASCAAESAFIPDLFPELDKEISEFDFLYKECTFIDD